jgi:hypothetical protein
MSGIQKFSDAMPSGFIGMFYSKKAGSGKRACEDRFRQKTGVDANFSCETPDFFICMRTGMATAVRNLPTSQPSAAPSASPQGPSAATRC